MIMNSVKNKAYMSLCSIQENVQQLRKRKKSVFLDFEKKTKNVRKV